MRNTKIILAIIFALANFQNNLNAQAIITSWQMNNGNFASYWQNTTGSMTNPNFVFNNTTIAANVTQVCYDSNNVYVKSNGMTNDMGKFMNPGAPTSQNYTFKFTRNPAAATTKITSPLGGAIGVLTNGIPIFGLGNAHFYNGTDNNGAGPGGTWHVEVYKAEGLVVDTTLGAHPQQQGAYHSHVKPQRLYNATGTNVHSPLVGYAFDGFPVYGPYGYSNATDATSAVARMKTGYSVRNITNRTTLANGTTVTAGPAVNATFPIGTYVEDYEWLAANNGTLDEFNGRFCKTPEYPNGIYAYFVTIDAVGTPQFPYYIGLQYYGVPATEDITFGAVITIPTNTSCFTKPLGISNANLFQTELNIYPIPATNKLNIEGDFKNSAFLKMKIIDINGKVCQAQMFTANAGVNNFSLNIDRLINGYYQLIIEDENLRSVAKVFVKQ
jgi:hypothetical protein